MKRYPSLSKLSCCLLAAALPALAQAPAVPPAAAPAVAGHWEGTIDIPGSGLVVKVDLKMDPAGRAAWSGTIDIPQQSAQGLPLDKLSVDGDHVRFSIAKIPGDPTFDGRLAGGEIRGAFTQGPATYPFHLGRDAVKPPRRPQEPYPPLPYSEEEIIYQNGDFVLAGTLTMPPGMGPFPAVLLISGSGAQNRNEELLGHKPFLVLADHLTRAGIGVLRVDDRGVGGSSGSVSEATSEDFAGDALAGVRFLQTQPRIAKDRVGLVGHSEGGLIAPLAASRSADVAFIVLLAGPGVPGSEIIPAQVQKIDRAEGMPEDKARRQANLTRTALTMARAENDRSALRSKLEKFFADHPEAIDAKALESMGGMQKFLDFQVMTLSSPWFRFFYDYDPRPALRKVRVPVLAVNGQLDTQVPFEQNLPAIEQALREAKNPDVTVRAMPGLNHLFQTAKTGSPTEYATIDETMAPAVLDLVTGWILERFAKPPKP
jgi:pimeloyl-ACP methyl ester carboxylesterase